MRLLQQLGALALDLFFPPFCVGCKKVATYFCTECFTSITFLLLPIKVDISPCFIDKILALADYTPPISNLIAEMKYHSVKNVARMAGQMLYYCFPLPPADFITYVPLHKNRQRQRGFNQALVMAEELSLCTKIPLGHFLIRHQATSPQAKLNHRADRLTHLEGVFSSRIADRFTNKTCLLIDDVTTTGSTLNECAKVLKCQLEFKQVIALTLAHGA